jgi:hypothetical protein
MRVFVVFDVLALEGRETRAPALIERKNPRPLIPFVLFADVICGRGCDFYRLVCARDLEGISAKWNAAPDQSDVAPSYGSRSRMLSMAKHGTGPSCSGVPATSEANLRLPC